MNTQKPEKPAKPDSVLAVDVQEIFFTIQGEGPFSGRRAVFIRLAGCNLQCPLCDTDYTSSRSLMPVVNVVERVKRLLPPNQYKRELVVITGGEPFRQNLRLLTDLLIGNYYDVQIETNGTLYQDLDFKKLTIVCSPKTSQLSKRLKPHINVLKYVVSLYEFSNIDNFLYSALQHPNHSGVIKPWDDFKGDVYVMPADEKDEKRNKLNIQLCVELAQADGYRLGIQLHKLIGAP